MLFKFRDQNVRKVATFEFPITTPYPLNDIQIYTKAPEKSQLSNFRSRVRALQTTSKFRGQNARKVATVEFLITTPYPWNDLQIERSKWQKSCLFRIWDHHSAPFERSPNLEVTMPEKLQLSNSRSPLPTIQMTSKFWGHFRIWDYHSLPFADHVSRALLGARRARPSGRATLLVIYTIVYGSILDQGFLTTMVKNQDSRCGPIL